MMIFFKFFTFIHTSKGQWWYVFSHQRHIAYYQAQRKGHVYFASHNKLTKKDQRDAERARSPQNWTEVNISKSKLVITRKSYTYVLCWTSDILQYICAKNHITLYIVLN